LVEFLNEWIQIRQQSISNIHLQPALMLPQPKLRQKNAFPSQAWERAKYFFLDSNTV
jgi:hypothetical protein